MSGNHNRAQPSSAQSSAAYCGGGAVEGGVGVPSMGRRRHNLRTRTVNLQTVVLTIRKVLEQGTLDLQRIIPPLSPARARPQNPPDSSGTHSVPNSYRMQERSYDTPSNPHLQRLRPRTRAICPSRHFREVRPTWERIDRSAPQIVHIADSHYSGRGSYVTYAKRFESGAQEFTFIVPCPPVPATTVLGSAETFPRAILASFSSM